jgi:hypothetical protein
MLNWPAISLLLHPWTSKLSTCWSLGVTLIPLRSIMKFLPDQFDLVDHPAILAIAPVSPNFRSLFAWELGPTATYT